MARLGLLCLFLALSGCASARVCYIPPDELLKPPPATLQEIVKREYREVCGTVWIWPWSPIGGLGEAGTPVHVTTQ